MEIDIEQMLYERAVRTKIRAPRAERLANIGHNRVLTSIVIAGAALICTVTLTNNGIATSSSAGGSGLIRSQMTDTDPSNGPVYHAPLPLHQQNTDPAIASVAMSQSR